MHNNNYYYEYNINYTELYLLELGDSSILLVMIDSEKKYHDSDSITIVMLIFCSFKITIIIVV